MGCVKFVASHVVYYIYEEAMCRNMKYFVDAEERVASGHENYIEFQPPAATEEFWNEASLYML